MLGTILKKSYDILRENLILVQPFILFLLLISVVAGSLQGVPKGFSPVLIAFFVSIFALTCAFLAGWFQLFQAAIRNSTREFSSKEEKIKASLDSFREFLPAVGRFFIPVTTAMILYILLFFGTIKLALFLGTKYIGFTHNISPENLLSIMSDEAKIKPFVESLTPLDRDKLLSWDLLMMGLVGLFSYLTMLWFPAIMLNGENAFKGFFIGVKSALSHPFVSLGVFFTYWVVNILTSFIGAITAGIFVFELLNLMLVVFVTVYFIMVSFVYFEEYSADHIAGWTNLFR